MSFEEIRCLRLRKHCCREIDGRASTILATVVYILLIAIIAKIAQLDGRAMIWAMIAGVAIIPIIWLLYVIVTPEKSVTLVGFQFQDDSAINEESLRKIINRADKFRSVYEQSAFPVLAAFSSIDQIIINGQTVKKVNNVVWSEISTKVVIVKIENKIDQNCYGYKTEGYAVISLKITS